MASYKKRTDDAQLAGELRHRITIIHRKVVVKSGITKETWEPLLSCWAMVENFEGREFWEAAALNREDEVRVTIRYRRGLDTTMRIVFGGHEYHITSILNPNMRSIKLEMLAKSVDLGKKG